ncbi:unnamed protein product [Diatraea saccharalis]|uniref:Uncharacterized protein n=1 Tax=Diatraea saccharalis TaxID=40085 RepID=A0A9N9R7A9_9NEOP|nr:unnamed protein product [Diatraea saccharalis]
MNISESVEESSSKRQENGDASCSSERPHKKARFAWQVKGKYHLKNESSDSSMPTMSLMSETDKDGPSSDSKDCTNKSFVGNTEQNLEILGDYLLKQDFTDFNSPTTNTDISLFTSSPRLNADVVHYPKYVCSFNSNNRSSSTFDITNNAEFVAVPMSMIVSQSYREDECISRWQSRQIAKGFVDNMINRVIDSWTHAPLPPHMDISRLAALDAAEFVNNLPEPYSRRRLNDSIENEGILMAISAHGLQNTSNSSSNNDSEDKEETSSTTNNNDLAFLSPPSSPVYSDEVLTIESNNKKLDTNESPLSDLLWPCDDIIQKDNDEDQLTFFPDNSNSYHFAASDNINTSFEKFEAVENVSSSHFDFMDAAVSFAIQNKGLTTFGTDYG